MKMNNLKFLSWILLFICCSGTSSCLKKKQEVVRKFINGNLRAEYEINKDSVKNGYYKLFFKSGHLELLANYKDGVLNGAQKYFYENGKTEQLSYYSNGNFKRGEKYDSNGNFKGHLFIPVFKAVSDTVKVGKFYALKISLWPPAEIKNGKIELYLNKSEIHNSKKVDVGYPVVSDSFKKEYDFERLFLTAGDYTLLCNITFIEENKYDNFATEMQSIHVIP